MSEVAAESVSKPKVTLYWLEKSRSQRILWLLTECNVDYDLKIFKRGADKLADPELKKIHPLGKSPVISIDVPGQEKPLIIAESAFITEYLADHFGKHLVPEQWQAGKEGQVGGETEEYLRYRYFMHYAEGSLMSMLICYYIVSMLRDGDQIPFFIKPITRAIVNKVEQMFFMPNFKTHFGFLEEQLSTSGGDYLCGKKLTAADILMSFPLLACKSGGIDIGLKNYPKVEAYTTRLENTESYKRSITIAEEKTGEKFTLL